RQLLPRKTINSHAVGLDTQLIRGRSDVRRRPGGRIASCPGGPRASDGRTVRPASPSSAAEAQLYGAICRNVAGFLGSPLNYSGYWRMLYPLSPDRVRRIHGQPELRALVRLGERVTAGAAGEAALRANGEPLMDDILRRFIDAPLQAVDCFEYRRFAADQP